MRDPEPWIPDLPLRQLTDRGVRNDKPVLLDNNLVTRYNNF